MTREINFWFRYNFRTEGRDPFQRSGPIFLGWLPGIEDAIDIRTIESGSAVKLFFNPRGQTNSDDENYPRHSDDPQMDEDVDIAKSYPLDAGPLFGTLLLQVTDAEFQAFVAAEPEANIGRVNECDEYLEVAKRVNLILTPIIKSFVGLLASRYGHAWFMPAKRSGSKAVHMQIDQLSDLIIYWKLDQSGVWHSLNPRNDILVVVRGYDQKDPGWYFGEKDWKMVEEELETFEGKSLAAEFLSQAVRELIDENIRHAVVDVVTAFEVAFSQHLSKIDSNEKYALDEIENFDRAPGIKHKVIAAYSFLGIQDKTILHRALRCIDLRNDFAHWGKTKKSGINDYSDQESVVEAMVQIVSILLFGSSFALPNRNIEHMVRKDSA